MFIDLTLELNDALVALAQQNLKKANAGHLGTHFDVMNKRFPLDYIRRDGVVFDISAIQGRDVDVCDVPMDQVKQGMFVAFYSGYIDQEGYGTGKYFAEHPQLSYALIEALVDRGVSLIGVDFSGVRNGREHTGADQYCADHGVFIIENMANLNAVLDAGGHCVMHTCPMSHAQWTGLPCRVIAEV